MKDSLSIYIFNYISIPVFFYFAAIPAAGQTFPLIQHIVVIGVDGMSTDGVKKASTPNLDEMMKQGAHSFKASAVMPTSSSSNWASMIMGAPPKKHKVKSNSWEVADVSGKSFCGNSTGEIWPTIFRLARDTHPDALIGCLADWEGFCRLVEENVCSLKKHVPGGADSTARAANEFITAHHPLFTFIHLDHVDHAGHEYGHGSEQYYKAVSGADSLIGTIINSLESAQMAENTVVLVTADHGGRGKGHWGYAPKVKRVPWIIAGPTIKKSFTISERIHTYDTAATLAFLLGISIPDCWVGHPIKSIIE